MSELISFSILFFLEGVWRKRGTCVLGGEVLVIVRLTHPPMFRCWCAYDDPDRGRRLDGNERCGVGCGGNKGQICGGEGTLLVYESG